MFRMIVVVFRMFVLVFMFVVMRVPVPVRLCVIRAVLRFCLACL